VTEMGQGSSCNCMSNLKKSVDGLHDDSLGEVVESQPTLLTSESHALQSSSLAVEPPCPSLPSQSPVELRAPTEPTMAPPSRGRSSSEYKYTMTQLLQRAEEEKMRRRTCSEPFTQMQYHGQQFEPQSALHQPHRMAPTEPVATWQEPSYQTSSSSRFQQIPHTVPLASGVDRLDPVVVEQFLKSRQCILVDVRGDDRVAGTIEGAIHVPAIDAVPFAIRVQECARQWKNHSLVIFHCQYSAHRAPQCANEYRDHAPASQRVAIMDGGFRGWESLGLPVQQGTASGGQQHSTNMYALQQGMRFAYGGS